MALTRTKLRDQVVQEIMVLLREDNIQPGESLPPERLLSERVGVSRTVVREALTGLEMQGMIELIPGKRPILRNRFDKAIGEALRRVVGDDLEGLRDLTQVRQIFEPEIAALFATNATEAQVEELQQAHERMKRQIDAPAGNIEADVAFHERLLLGVDNHVLISMLRPVSGILQRSRELTTWRRRSPEGALAEHAAVLEHIVARDAAGARRAMVVHMDSTVQDVAFAIAEAERLGWPADQAAR